MLLEVNYHLPLLSALRDGREESPSSPSEASILASVSCPNEDVYISEYDGNLGGFWLGHVKTSLVFSKEISGCYLENKS